MRLKLDTLRFILPPGDARADALAGELSADAERALVDIRRLVYGLRPPVLDQLGLGSAIREHALGLAGLGNGLSLDVEADDPLPALPAAVEVAAYRIATEAMTNVARHARAQHGWVNIRVLAPGSEGARHSTLAIDVDDDGIGVASHAREGLGWRSMRQRAEELGGSLAILKRPAGGTRIAARLPI
jgi:signal transduction histidine kinase